MPNKYRLGILIGIALAIIAIIVFSGAIFPGSGEETNDQPAAPGSELPPQQKAEQGAVFKASDDPYRDFMQARSDQKPILLEFYGRF